MLKKIQDKSEIFILTKKDTNWSTRYFVKESKRDNLYRELEIKPQNKKYLWQSLRIKKIFVLPNSDEVRDSIGQPLKLTLQNEICYCFKIFTKAGERELIYHSPEAYMKEFPQEPAYRDVVALLRLVYTFCGLEYRY